MNTIQEIEKEQIEKLTADRKIPKFNSGDTMRVNVKVVEGTRERVQAFEGMCISRKNDGLHSSFTVRKISYGEGVERVFQLYSPNLDSIEVIRRGDVRRAKLYYLRGRQGKRARIAERTDGYAAKLSQADRDQVAADKATASAKPAKEVAEEVVEEAVEAVEEVVETTDSPEVTEKTED